MAVEVKKYYARWSPEKHTGYVGIYWDGGYHSFPESSFTNPVEFQIVLDLLRNEKPIWWDERSGRLYAHEEPVGEGEVAHP